MDGKGWEWRGGGEESEMEKFVLDLRSSIDYITAEIHNFKLPVL